MKNKTILFTTVLFCLMVSTPLLGQDYRIFTKVSDISQSREKPNTLGRSLSLFHAGKVYDYIDSTGEVTVFEPAKNRFIILDTKREIFTVADLGEIKHHLKVARKVINEHIQTLSNQTKENSKDKQDTEKVIQNLTFQLNPQFQIDDSSNALTLQGTGIRYSATGAKNNSKELVNAFFEYTDWIARLNYVLHPRAVSPESRLILNEQLRTRQLMPISVELKTDNLYLRAEHQIHWSLNARDRRMIHRWTTLLKSKSTKKVTLRAYQRIVVAGKN